MDEKIRKAAELGAAAFNRGALRVPAHDPGLAPLLRGNKIGEGFPILKAWLRAWDAENLKPITSAWSYNRLVQPL